MPEYVVKQGDCILSIAKDFGFFWQTLWNDPQNAQLKQLRKDPNVLFPGDVVFIRDKQVRLEPKPTDARHKFVRKAGPAMLRLQLLDRNHKPRPNLTYVLSIDSVLLSGTTDARGWIEETMPPNAKHADLTVTDAGSQESYSIQLGSVDPITEMSGVTQRLQNLGYSSDPSGLTQSLRSFQKKYGLPETGNPDDPTRQKLKSLHGC